MHILLISTSYPDQTTGSEAAGSFVADFAEELARDIKVTVLAPSCRDKNESCGNVKIHHFAAPRLPLSLLRPTRPTHWGVIFKTAFSGQKTVEQLLSTQKIDHVFALWALPSGYWARASWKRYGIPYSVWALGSNIWNLGGIPLVKILLRNVLRDSDVCFAEGYILKKDVEKISGKPCEFLASTRRLPAVEEKSLSTAPPYKLVYLGQWHRNKGTDILLDSLHLLNDEDWERIEEVRIFGGGPLEKIIKSGYAALKEAGYPVLLGGYLDRTQAAKLLLWTDYLLIPSRIESIPAVFSDAMQCMCPVIATVVGDLPALIEKYGVGIMASGLTPDAFSRAIKSALKQSAGDFKGKITLILKKFDIDEIALKFVNAMHGTSKIRGGRT